MVWRRRYPFNYMMRDFEQMMAELENYFQPFVEGRFLPPGGVGDRMLPAIRGEFRVDVREHENEVIVVVDLPGVEKDDVTLHLLNPRTLEVVCERKADTEEKKEGYYMRERVYGSMNRIVTLPNDVTEEGATATFKNGVLEVRMKKVTGERGSRIPIE